MNAKSFRRSLGLTTGLLFLLLALLLYLMYDQDNLCKTIIWSAVTLVIGSFLIWLCRSSAKKAAENAGKIEWEAQRRKKAKHDFVEALERIRDVIIDRFTSRADGYDRADLLIKEVYKIFEGVSEAEREWAYLEVLKIMGRPVVCHDDESRKMKLNSCLQQLAFRIHDDLIELAIINSRIIADPFA